VRDKEIVNYRNYRRGPQEFQGLSIYRLHPGRFELESRLFAQRARWHSGHWFLEEGWFRDLSPDGEEDFEEFRLLQVVDPDFPREIFTAGYRFPFSFLPDAAKKTSEQMSFLGLREYIQQLRRGNYNVQELEVALYTKLSFPLIPLVMVLIGVPFAFRSGRRGTMVGLGMSLLLVLLYYACFAVLGALGNSGFLPPALAAWGPNLLFAAGAIYLLAHLKS
jgi:lipopolysaccharide export LptBFGC system permease protein LptF